MILSRLSVKSAPQTHTKEQFHLFKPLLLIAMSACFFELLPIDFQHAIAPLLVSYEEVFNADNRRPEIMIKPDEEISVNVRGFNGFPPDPAEMTIRN
jgi:hypothetical protein